MTTYCINLSNKQVTEYTNMDAIAFERINGKHYAVCADGIYLIGNGESQIADDDGAPINATVTTGMTDFKSTNLKRIQYAYIGAEGTITLQMATDANGLTSAFTSTHTGAGIGTRRIKMGKGLEARYWQAIINNVAGANFELDTLELLPIVLSRGVS